MLSTLLESNAARRRRPAGAALSVVVHAVLIGLAAVATAGAASRAQGGDDTLVPLRVAPPPPPTEPIAATRASARRSSTSSTASAAAPAPLLPTPIDVPDVLPAVDPSATTRSLVGDADFKGAHSASASTGSGSGTGVGSASGDGVFEPGLERSALLLPNSPRPRYPEMLRTAGITGRVLVRFVVDTLGRAEAGTLKIVSSDHDLLTSSVRAALTQLRFVPAEANGRRVRQWVEVPFEFSLGR